MSLPRRRIWTYSQYCRDELRHTRLYCLYLRTCRETVPFRGSERSRPEPAARDVKYCLNNPVARGDKYCLCTSHLLYVCLTVIFVDRH